MSSAPSSVVVPTPSLPASALTPIPLVWQMLLSGSAASWAEACTIPFDTAKVRLQIQDKANPKYRGLVHVITSIVRDEGVYSLWRGVSAGIQRQCAFAPIRIGLYEPVRNAIVPADQVGPPTILQKIAAGLTTSAVGITVASPTDVVKVRLQAEGRLPPGVPRRYNGSLDAYKKIVATEGVAGLWTGYGPNLARNCVVSATELVAYDQSKQTFLSLGFSDDIYTHLLCGLTAGFAATMLGSPVDVVKTRVMNAKKAVAGAAPPAFNGPIDCAMKILASEGPLGFYAGFIPNFARIGSWNIVAFVTLEQLKLLYRSLQPPTSTIRAKPAV